MIKIKKTEKRTPPPLPPPSSPFQSSYSFLKTTKPMTLILFLLTVLWKIVCSCMRTLFFIADLLEIGRKTFSFF